MALAIDAEDLAVGIGDRHAVVVARAVLLEEGDRDDDSSSLASFGSAQHAGVLAHGISGREPFRVLPRREIDALEQLGRQDDLRASPRRLAHEGLGLGDVGRHVVAVGRLDGRDGDRALRHLERLLLRDAVERAAAGDRPSRAARARGGRPPCGRGTALQALRAPRRGRRAVDGHDDDAVGDDEVHMRGRERSRRARRAPAPGPGMRTTSSLRPDASVAASSVRAMAFEHFGVGIVAHRQATGRRRGQARRSGRGCRYGRRCGRCFRPWSIQMIFLAPKASRSAASACSSVQPLRLGLSSVCRVVRIVPSPSCSTAPPSSTKSKWRIGVAGKRAMSSPTVASSGRSNLPPQPLVLKRSASAPVAAPREDRAGVAQPDVAVARRHELGRVAKRGAGRSLGLGAVHQELDTCCCALSARTSAATSRRGARRSPFHCSGSAGQAVQMAFCGAHSAGTEICSVTPVRMYSCSWFRQVRSALAEIVKSPSLSRV